MVSLLDEVISSDFKANFSEHSFYLELLDNLSLHSLLILKDNMNWPTQIVTTGGGRHVQGNAQQNDWYIDFIVDYSRKPSFENYTSTSLHFVELVIRELHTNGRTYFN